MFTSPETTPMGTGSVSSGNSEITPKMDSLTLGRGRGRPRKKLNYSIDMEDFPEHGTKEEQEKYLKKKQTELWRFKKLSGDEAAEHRAKENVRVKNYYYRKKAEKSGSSTVSVPPDDTDNASEESIAEKKREQSRKR